MLFFNLVFHFSIWCTDPPKIVNFQSEYIIAVQQRLTLNCGAEGNPPPTYTWTPCDPEQVCDKNTLGISQVLNDTNYTCRVATVYGSESKTANVCRSHIHCSHAYYTAVSSYMCQHDILIGFSQLNQGIACQVIKAQIVPLLYLDG